MEARISRNHPWRSRQHSKPALHRLVLPQAMGREVIASGNIPLSANPCLAGQGGHSGSRSIVSVYPGSAISGRTRLASFNPSSVDASAIVSRLSHWPYAAFGRSEIRFPGKVPALHFQPLTGGCRNRGRHIKLAFWEQIAVLRYRNCPVTRANRLRTVATDLTRGAEGVNSLPLFFTKN